MLMGTLSLSFSCQMINCNQTGRLNFPPRRNEVTSASHCKTFFFHEQIPSGCMGHDFPHVPLDLTAFIYRLWCQGEFMKPRAEKLWWHTKGSLLTSGSVYDANLNACYQQTKTQQLLIFSGFIELNAHTCVFCSVLCHLNPVSFTHRAANFTFQHRPVAPHIFQSHLMHI